MMSVERALEVAREACRAFSRPGGLVPGQVWDKYEGAAEVLKALGPFVAAALAYMQEESEACGGPDYPPYTVMQRKKFMELAHAYRTLRALSPEEGPRT